MSFKTWLTPKVTERMFSEQALLKRRAKAERRRIQQGRPHQVEYFHQVSDPYSALTAQILKDLCKRYHIELTCHLVPPPDQSAAPELEMLMQHSLRDAQLLSQKHQIMIDGFERTPSKKETEHAELILCHALLEGTFVEQAQSVSKALWGPDNSPSKLESFDKVSPARLKQKLVQGAQRRAQLGHYLGATFYYEGEWYWGPDRLHYLEQRLGELKLRKLAYAQNALLFTPLKDGHPQAARSEEKDQRVLEFFFSIRSPYSAIVTPRVFELARQTGARIEYRFVLPMVMRGLPVPKSKRQYIVLDTAREARLHGVPFGKMNDPVGRPTERVLAILHWAIGQNKAQQWLLSAFQGIWSEGVDAGSDRGLKQLVENAGLNWEQAKLALQNDEWRKQAEINRQTLFSNELWGVPSFKVEEQMFWGQDRLWAVRHALTTNTRLTGATA